MTIVCVIQFLFQRVAKKESQFIIATTESYINLPETTDKKEWQRESLQRGIS